MKKLLVILLLLFPVHGAWAETMFLSCFNCGGSTINCEKSPSLELKIDLKEENVKMSWWSWDKKTLSDDINIKGEKGAKITLDSIDDKEIKWSEDNWLSITDLDYDKKGDREWDKTRFTLIRRNGELRKTDPVTTNHDAKIWIIYKCKNK